MLFVNLFLARLHRYAHLSNQEVFDHIIAGYRLEQPETCPDVIYSFMLECWESNPLVALRSHLSLLFLLLFFGLCPPLASQFLLPRSHLPLRQQNRPDFQYLHDELRDVGERLGKGSTDAELLCSAGPKQPTIITAKQLEIIPVQANEVRCSTPAQALKQSIKSESSLHLRLFKYFSFRSFWNSWTVLMLSFLA